MKFGTQIVFIGLMTLVLIGCVTNPVYDVVNAPVSTSSRNYSAYKVRAAILKAGASLGWQMRDTAPGQIIATLNIRDHMAQVEISYNRNTYSIIYRDSHNLDYDGQNIHKNYNSWVRNLSTKINTRLSSL